MKDCHHSQLRKDCEVCQWQLRRFAKRKERIQELRDNPPRPTEPRAPKIYSNYEHLG